MSVFDLFTNLNYMDKNYYFKIYGRERLKNLHSKKYNTVDFHRLFFFEMLAMPKKILILKNVDTIFKVLCALKISYVHI